MYLLQLGWPLADGDDYHPAANIQKMIDGIPLTDEASIIFSELIFSICCIPAFILVLCLLDALFMPMTLS